MKSKIIFICYFFLILFSIVFIVIETDYQFVQNDLAMDFTLKYFAIPIVLLTIPSSYLIYFYFQNKSDSNSYFKQKNKHDAKSIFRISFMAIVISLVLIVGTNSIIIKTNEYFGNNETVFIDSKITNAFSTKYRGAAAKHYIFALDKKSNKIIEFQVKNNILQVGQDIKLTMKVGKWGILYLK